MKQNGNESVVIFERAALMLAEADTIQKAHELKSLCLTAADWAKRKGMGQDAIRLASSYALEAERKMGEMLLATERAKPPGRPKKSVTAGDRFNQETELPVVTSGNHGDKPPTLEELGVTKRESAEAQMLAALPDATFDSIKSGDKTRVEVRREARRTEVIASLENVKTKEAKAIQGVYDVITIDPPWPMERIETDVRPNQTKELDYPVMSVEEIAAVPVPYADDCHVWLWTTHRFLPMAFGLLEGWGLRYVCTFVWHKDCGCMQPLGLPKYNCEFALYARKGSPKFVDFKAFNVCLTGKRGKHSEKPTEFYDMLTRVTRGRRLEMYARKDRKGWDAWGNEV